LKFLKHKFILPITVFFMLGIFNLPLSAENTPAFSQETTVIPCGLPVGIAVYTNGLIITATSSVTDINGKEVNVAKQTGLKAGDIILKANEQKVNTAEEFVNIITAQNTVGVTVSRKGKVFNTTINPIETHDGKKAGLWVRDSTAGIGTLTFYNPDTGEFTALGHGISDSDTGNFINVRFGNLYECKVTGVIKGKKGNPGEINGVFKSKIRGSITKNTASGISGIISKKIGNNSPVKFARKNEITEGNASILCDVDGNGAKEYQIQILKMNLTASDEKNYIIKVTDKSLIEKTGGIVQGMSGSPIVQNGRLVGAVTHVFVNDPTRGYGIFIENMLSKVEKIK